MAPEAPAKAPAPAAAPAAAPGKAPAAAPAVKPAASAAPAPTGDHRVLADAYPEEVTGFETLEDGAGVTVVHPDGLFVVARRVRDLGYRILSLLSGYDTGKEFGVLYAFARPANTPAEFQELRLRVRMPRTDADGKPAEPACQSIVDVFPAAGWQEREAWDLFGIRFEGNPDLRRIFMPEGWHGFPGRKDDKEPEQFVAMRDGEDIVLKTQEEGSW